MSKFKLVFILVTLSSLLLIPLALAHETEISHEESVATSTLPSVTLEDLGVTKTGLLPTNPFYFVKEWERKIRIFFAGNPLKKAELELKFANEKAAELKRIAEDNPTEDALNRAIENYDKSVDRLRGRLEALQDSENPNIGDLLSRLQERATKHQQLFEELKDKNGVALEKLEQAQNKISEKLLKRGEGEVRPPPPPKSD